MIDNNNAPDNWVPVQQNQQSGTVADDQWVRVDTDHHGNTDYDNFRGQGSDQPQDKSQLNDQQLEDQGEGDFATMRKGGSDGQQPAKSPAKAQPGAQDKPLNDKSKVSREMKPITNEDLMAFNHPMLKDGQKPLTSEAVKRMSDFPDHGLLNTLVTDPAVFVSNDLEKHLVEPLTGKPLVDDQEDVDRLAQKHPISSIVSGFSSWIVTAPLFPTRLLQFVGMPLLNDIGNQRVRGSLMDSYSDTTMKNRALLMMKDVVISAGTERLLGATEAFEVGTSKLAGGAKWAAYPVSQAEEYLKKPFASFLAKVGFIAAGNTAMHAMYGDDLAQSFKDGAVQGAILHMGEVPHLAQTALGRGIIAHVNRYMDEREMAWTERQKQLQSARENFIPGKTPFSDTEIKNIKFNLPITHINPDDPDKDHLQATIRMALNNMAGDMDIHNPKIVAATIKLPDGSEIHGTSHEDALNKIGLKKTDGEKAYDDLLSRGSEEGMPSAKSAAGKAPGTGVNLPPDNLDTSKEGSTRYTSPSQVTNFESIDASNSQLKYTTGKKIAQENSKPFSNDIERATGVVPSVRVKSKDSYVGKIERFNHHHKDPNHIADLLAARVIVPEGDIYKQVDNIKNNFKVVSVDDFREAPSAFGYKGINIKVRLPNGLLAEIQIHTPETVAKADAVHKIYEKFRNKKTEDLTDKDKKDLSDALIESKRITDMNRGDFAKEFLPQKGSVEGKDYEAGFTVLNPDGKTEFISRAKSKEKPFNLRTGHSAEVRGLNESKFITPPPSLKITNPDTLKFINNNEGKMHVNMLLGVPEVAEMLQKSHEELTHTFTPYEIGQEGALTAQMLRENLGILARNNDRLEASLRKARDIFEKADKNSSLEFIYKMEEGAAQGDVGLQKIADTLRNMLDTKRDEVIALGTGKLENWIENYFPHVLEKPGQAANIFKRIMGRRPFEGPKGFLKKRTIPTMREVIDLGFTPVSYNPIDSVMLRIREMERYLMAHRTIQALKEQGIIQFVRDGEKRPDGTVDIDDRFGEVKYKNAAKETVLAGKYVIQADAGRILNNYLSPGLRGKSYIYDLYRGAGNTLNQFQLGISAFHLGFTSMDATISKFALGINKLSTGNFAGAVKEFGTAPFAPITNIMQGRDLLQAWYGKDKGELTNTIADLMASAGGRAKMDKFYATGMKDSMMKSIKEGKLATAAFKVPFYIVEQCARPIMEYIVPRQKMGVFMDMMKMEMERNPNMSHEQMRGIAQKAWNSVDNRMGQLVYDNLFWNHVTKDLAMASVRSLGWNLGTVREIGGGVQDVFGNVQDVIHGKATKMSYRTAYVMALPIVTGLYGAIYQYLHTGLMPGQGHEDEGISGRLRDLFFPRNGAVDNRGGEARISLPTYMKDIYHYTSNPVQTVINKFSPVNNAVMEMLNNKDYYGTEIRNVDDPAMQQIGEESAFMASQFLPFGFRNQGRDTRTSLGSKIEPFIGLVPAPYDVNMSKAEREAYEFGKSNIPPGSRTKEQAKHSQDKYKLMSNYMSSKDRAPIDEAVKDGIISRQEAKTILKAADMTPMERLTHNLTFEQVNHLLKVATPKEKDELLKILEKKKAGKKSRGTWTQAEEDLYAKDTSAE